VPDLLPRVLSLRTWSAAHAVTAAAKSGHINYDTDDQPGPENGRLRGGL